MHKKIKAVRIMCDWGADGYRQPGDEYERTKADAAKLKAAGVVSIVTTRAK